MIPSVSQRNRVSTCVGKRSSASETLCRAGRPFPLAESPFTTTPRPPPPSESDEGETCTEVSVSISLTQAGFRSTWKSAEILQLLETSKRARLMKNGSTCKSSEKYIEHTSRVCLMSNVYGNRFFFPFWHFYANICKKIIQKWSLWQWFQQECVGAVVKPPTHWLMPKCTLARMRDSWPNQ